MLSTVVISSTEAKFIEVTVRECIYMYYRSVMWDLGVSQCATTIAYQDMMAQTWKPNATGAAYLQ